MKILHTSDWHIGRTFHAHSTNDHLGEVLSALVEIVVTNRVQVVVVSGDVFDSATPAAASYDLLTAILTALRAAGAIVIMTSGNHDSATRLGFNSGFTGLAGIHVLTRPHTLDQPVIVDDEHGPVRFYGIPYLEPSLVRHSLPHQRRDAEPLRTHSEVLGWAMQCIRADLAASGARSVVLAHAFIADVVDHASSAHQSSPHRESAEPDSPATPDLERDISAGGLDLVPLSVFDGPDYVALGHIHGRARLSDRATYSGAPLHFSFGEAGKPRGAWLVELDAGGLSSVDWVDLPIPRRLTVLTGELEQLLSDPVNEPFEGDWVSAILTDRVRPMDSMRRLQSRFPFAALLEHRPSIVTDAGTSSYGERIRSRSDREIVDGFLELVRNGIGTQPEESILITDTIARDSVDEFDSTASAAPDQGERR